VKRRLWVDANVIIRFLVGSPPELAEQARALMGRAERGEVVLVVTDVVLAEVFWVLRSFYGHPVWQVAGVLQDFLLGPGIRSAGGRRLLAALELVAAHGVDIADALLAVEASQAGEPVGPFDQDFEKLPVVLEGPG
jgi:predicted nucleic acid-binding protein